MANELFDKKIKEKLEAVNRPVSPNLWDNIRKKMYVPWYFDFWRKYGLPLYSTIATVLLLVNLKDKFNYEEQFRLLNEKISTIQQIKPATQVQTLVHRDTVYISKTIYLVERAQNNPNKPLLVPQEKTPVAQGNAINPTQEPAKPLETKPEEKLIALEQETPKDEEKTIDNLPAKDSAAKINTLKTPTQTEPPRSPKKTFRWPEINTRLGLNVGYGFKNSMDVGPAFEVFMGKSLSFSTGVSIVSHPESEYFNPKDFNTKTRQDFGELYQPHLPPKSEKIEDIHIKASMLTIPLNLNYYLPLNKQWDVKFLLGTNIDLRLYQNVKFESHIDGDEYYSSFDTEQKKGFWHSITFGTGLQYHSKRYAFQLTPAYIYHYRETDFLSPKRNFTLTGSVLIDLKRK